MRKEIQKMEEEEKEEDKQPEEDTSIPPVHHEAPPNPNQVTEEEIDQILDGTYDLHHPNGPSGSTVEERPSHPLRNMTYEGLRRLDGEVRRPGPYDRPPGSQEEDITMPGTRSLCVSWQRGQSRNQLSEERCIAKKHLRCRRSST